MEYQQCKGNFKEINNDADKKKAFFTWVSYSSSIWLMKYGFFFVTRYAWNVSCEKHKRMGFKRFRFLKICLFIQKMEEINTVEATKSWLPSKKESFWKTYFILCAIFFFSVSPFYLCSKKTLENTFLIGIDTFELLL